jgi:hypothetical protein
MKKCNNHEYFHKFIFVSDFVQEKVIRRKGSILKSRCYNCFKERITMITDQLRFYKLNDDESKRILLVNEIYWKLKELESLEFLYDDRLLVIEIGKYIMDDENNESGFEKGTHYAGNIRTVSIKEFETYLDRELIKISERIFKAIMGYKPLLKIIPDYMGIIEKYSKIDPETTERALIEIKDGD